MVTTARDRLAEALAAGPVVLAVEPTLEAVLGAVGLTYLAHAKDGEVRLETREMAQPLIGESVVDAPTSQEPGVVELARRVYAGFARHISRGCRLARGGTCPERCRGACLRRLAYAAATGDPAMPEAIHRYVRLAFAVGPLVRSMPQDERVARLDALARYTSNECEHTRQFVRFSHLSDGSWLAVFRPNADTIPLTADYFCSRMRDERFCVLDPAHLVAAFHDPAKGRGACCVRLDRETADLVAARQRELAPDERYVRAMWHRFYHGLALMGRSPSERGYDLRASWMPRRFWGGLTELDPRNAEPGPFVPPAYRNDGGNDGAAGRTQPRPRIDLR